MSGIYITGMEMPKDGCHHMICVYADGTVSTGGRVYMAVPVPEHGRLIDADTMTAHFKEIADIEWNKKAAPLSWSYAFEDVMDDIANAPTIIPASGGNKDE